MPVRPWRIFQFLDMSLYSPSSSGGMVLVPEPASVSSAISRERMEESAREEEEKRVVMCDGVDEGSVVVEWWSDGRGLVRMTALFGRDVVARRLASGAADRIIV